MVLKKHQVAKQLENSLSVNFGKVVRFQCLCHIVVVLVVDDDDVVCVNHHKTNDCLIVQSSCDKTLYVNACRSEFLFKEQQLLFFVVKLQKHNFLSLLCTFYCTVYYE